MMTTTTDTTRRIEWTNSKGNQVVAEIEIVTTRDVSLDGDRSTVGCCEWVERVEVIGTGHYGYSIERIQERQVGAITVAGKAGNIAIPAAQMTAIDAARAELRVLPVWVAHEALIDRNRSEVAEYEAHAARVNHMMTCNGKTY